MDLAGSKTETAFNIMSSLKNKAWDACGDLSVEILESDRGMKEILARLYAVFKYDAMSELLQDFENFFIQMQRKRNETMQEYTQPTSGGSFVNWLPMRSSFLRR